MRRFRSWLDSRTVPRSERLVHKISLLMKTQLLIWNTDKRLSELLELNQNVYLQKAARGTTYGTSQSSLLRYVYRLESTAANATVSMLSDTRVKSKIQLFMFQKSNTSSLRYQCGNRASLRSPHTQGACCRLEGFSGEGTSYASLKDLSNGTIMVRETCVAARDQKSRTHYVLHGPLSCPE